METVDRDPLDQVKIILVEPLGPLNIGSVARVMKNMGLQNLVLVNPQCDPFSEPARQMAVHGNDILAAAQIEPNLPEALKDCHRAIATTSRTRALATTMEHPRTALSWLLDTPDPAALIFGPEDRGLNNQELNYAQRFVAIPANPVYPSLNLAQAVAICVYELYQASLPPLPRDLVTPDSANLEQLEGYYQHLETVLLKVGYLHPHTVTARMEKFRRIYNRIQLTQEEVALLRGVLRQVDWALGISEEE